jgi:anti-anti-sigma factor
VADGIVTRDRTSGTIVLSGDFDISTTQEVRHALEACDAAHPAALDLALVTFLDSTVLNLLALTARRGVPVRVVNPSPFAARLIKLTGLDELLGVG